MTTLSRSTQTSSAPVRLHGLDTLRAFAILWVMPYHLISYFPEPLHWPARFGWMGVDLFFVLSGFLIGSQMLRPYLHGRSLRIRAFYIRRAYRILPAFFTVLLLYMLLPVWREAPGLQHPWQFATFTENLFIDYGRNQAFSHAWSLCVEEHFYLLLPLLTAVLMMRPAAWKVYALLLGVLLFGIGMRAHGVWHTLRPLGVDDDRFSTRYIETMYYPTYVRLDGLLAGVSLALMQAFRPRWWAALQRRGHTLTAIGIALVGVTGWLMFPRMQSLSSRAVAGDLFGYPLLALGFALLTASALSTGGLLARVRVPGARLLATLAFSLYLTHKEAVHLLVTLFPRLPSGT
jgi:peptidoglycan/LPS O-acetylase OafA/YrhL